MSVCGAGIHEAHLIMNELWNLQKKYHFSIGYDILKKTETRFGKGGTTVLEIFGAAAIPTMILLGVGLVMLFIELFTPGFGVAGITGAICLGAAVILQFAAGNKTVATILLAIVLLIIILAIVLFVRSFNNGKLSKSFLVLNDKIDAPSSVSVDDAKTFLVGKQGITLTALRPAGIAEIDGARVDVMTSGAFLEKGESVTVIKAEGMQVLVKKTEAQPDEIL